MITADRLRHFLHSEQARPVAAGKHPLLIMHDQLEDPHSSLSRLWDKQCDKYVKERVYSNELN